MELFEITLEEGGLFLRAFLQALMREAMPGEEDLFAACLCKIQRRKLIKNVSSVGGGAPWVESWSR